MDSYAIHHSLRKLSMPASHTLYQIQVWVLLEKPPLPLHEGKSRSIVFTLLSSLLFWSPKIWGYQLLGSTPQDILRRKIFYIFSNLRFSCLSAVLSLFHIFLLFFIPIFTSVYAQVLCQALSSHFLKKWILLIYLEFIFLTFVCIFMSTWNQPSVFSSTLSLMFKMLI